VKLYYLGAEIPGWRKLLAQELVHNVGLSFLGLARRVKFARPWLIQDKFPEYQHVMLESGATTINSNPDKYQREEVEQLLEKYIDFVQANVDRVDLISEMDVLHLGKEWLARQRQDLSAIAGDRFLPIWHEESGLNELERLAESYGRVGIAQSAIAGRDITSMLRRLTEDGIKLHGVGMTQIESMRLVGWDSVASTSWLSPAKYGDSQIWTGTELKRYPKKYKDQGRRRHRHVLEEAGFDADAFEADDTTEVLRVAIWSWERFVESINKEGVPSIVPDFDSDTNSDFDPDGVGSELAETRTEIQTRAPEERMLLPGLSLSQVTRSELGEDGESRTTVDTYMGVGGTPLRACDTCSIKRSCPAFRPSTSCAYEIPVELKTRDQLAAARDAIMAMQFQRIAFMRVVEEARGGYADTNLTKEIEVWNKMVAKRIEEESDIEELTIRHKRRGAAQTGLVSQIFGEKAGEKARELEAPVTSDQLFADAGIVEAEIVQE